MKAIVVTESVRHTDLGERNEDRFCVVAAFCGDGAMKRARQWVKDRIELTKMDAEVRDYEWDDEWSIVKNDVNGGGFVSYLDLYDKRERGFPDREYKWSAELVDVQQQ